MKWEEEYVGTDKSWNALEKFMPVLIWVKAYNEPRERKCGWVSAADRKRSALKVFFCQRAFVIFGLGFWCNEKVGFVSVSA